MFTKESAVVRSWVNVLTSANPKYTVKDIPTFFNLRKLVEEALKEREKAEE